MNIRFYNARILTLTDEEKFDVINGELWVKGNEIIYIGDGNDTDNVFATAECCKGISSCCSAIVWDREIDVKGNLLMPGFKNAHAHTYMTFLRSFADDLPLQEWLFNQVFPKEDQLVEQNIYDLDILGFMEYLTSGITSAFDMSFYPPTVAKAAQDFGFRSVGVSGVNSFGGDLGVVEYNYNAVNETGDLSSFMIGFHAEYTTQMDMMEGIAALAQKYHSPVYLHNSETSKEVAECIERYGITPTQLTDKLGMYEYGGGGFHCCYLNDEDMDIFLKKGLNAVSCPASNLKLASGIAPLKKFTDLGINIALGTDGPASNNALDMFREMYLAATLAKVREMDAECVSADKILYAATTGGAKAMGLEDCDRLAVGKKADIIMIDLMQPNMQPMNNIVKNLVYAGGKQNVVMTMINGKILYENGIFKTSFDPAEVYAKANEIIGAMH